jgi:hypothetical protein
MKIKQQFICSKCGLTFQSKEKCEEHEKLCKTCCEIVLRFLIYGEHIELLWDIDKSIHTTESVLKNLYKVGKTGPVVYRCYSNVDQSSIKHAKEVIKEFVLKELEAVKKKIEEEI